MSGLRISDTTNRIRILHVDDDACLLEISKQILQLESGFEIDNALSVDEAKQKMQTTCYDAIVSDYEMKPTNGLEFLKELRENKNTTPFILLTGRGREEVAIQALNLGADGYINKIGQPETVFGELTHIIQLAVDRNQAKQALQESEQRYKALMEQATISIIVHDLKGQIIDANQQTCKNLAYTKQELLKLSICDIDTNATHPKNADMWTKVTQGQNFTFEATHKRKDGTVFPIEVSLGSIKIGPTTLIMGLVRDLTQIKKDQEELQKSEEKYRNIVELSPDGIITTTMNGKITSVNQAFAELTGYTKEEIIGKHFTKLGTLKAGDIPTYLRFFGSLLIGKMPEKIEFTYIRKDQTHRIAEAHIRIMKENDKKIGIQAILRDITELKHIAKTSFEKENTLNLLLDNSLQGIIHYDLEQRVTLINRKACEFLKGEPKDFIGKKISEIHLEETSSLIIKRMKEAKQTKQNAVYEDQTDTPRGKRWFRSVYNRIIDQEANMIGLQIVFDDITEKKNIEQQLTRTSQELTAESGKLRVLNEKMEVMCKLTKHDLNNKLAAIKAYTYMLNKSMGENQDLKSYLNQIDASVTSAEHLLKLSDLTKNIGQENLTPTNVAACFNKSAALFPELEKFKVESTCQDLEVMADRQLEQLFYNLIDNSIKHGQKVNQISLTYKKEPDKTTITYQDNGIGIPETLKTKIFQEGFTTADSSGYGLYLIQRILQGYGWTIKEEGTPNQGAKFIISIPNQQQKIDTPKEKLTLFLASPNHAVTCQDK
jgi:PAS domain S-box-containing protein